MQASTRRGARGARVPWGVAMLGFALAGASPAMARTAPQPTAYLSNF